MPNLSWLPFVLVPIGFVWVSSYFLYAYIKRMRNHPFPDRKTADFVFRERRASGCSDKDFMSRYGGAKNCLTVTVTKGELMIWAPDLMAAISQRIDLECRVPLGDIESVTQTGKRSVDLRYRLPDGTERTLTLWLKSLSGFVNALTPQDYQRQCVIHLKSTREGVEALAAQIASLIDGARLNGAWVMTSWGSIGVEVKDEWDREHGPRDGETHHLELVAAESVGTAVFRDEVVGLLRVLDRAGLDPEPACDFEDELVGWRLGE